MAVPAAFPPATPLIRLMMRLVMSIGISPSYGERLTVSAGAITHERRRERSTTCSGNQGTSHAFSVELVQEFLGNVASIVGKLLQHYLVQPDVHLCRIAHFLSGTSEFCGQFLSRIKAAVNSEELQEIYDRHLPIELFFMLGCQVSQLSEDVDGGDRRRSYRSRGCRLRSGLGGGRAQTELFKDCSEETHDDLLSSSH